MARNLRATNVSLPPALKSEAEILGRQFNKSLSELVRMGLKVVVQDLKKQRAGEDPFYADDYVFDGPVPADLSTDHDKYLYGGKS